MCIYISLYVPLINILIFLAHNIIYTGAVAIHIFPAGTGAIHLDDLHCSGNEFRLIDCPHSGVGVHNCAHGDDAGVRCARSRTLIRNATMTNLL